MTEYAAIITMPDQAEIMWRALWAELEKIDSAFAQRLTQERDAHAAHQATIAILRQINSRFRILSVDNFEKMVDEARLPERKWA